MTSAIQEYVDDLALVDHHVHGAFRADGSEARFQNSLNEAAKDPLTDPAAAYDSQLGFAVRRWCSEILDLPVHAAPDEYWRRRCELGEAEVNRRMLGAAGVDHWLVDTGFRADDLLSVRDIADLSGGQALDVVRLESVAETVAAQFDCASDYADTFRDALTQRSRTAIAAKSVIAYRIGFAHDLSRPSDSDVAAAAGRWLDTLDAPGDPRLVDPVLLRFGIHTAVDLGLPLQLHVGLGDSDLDLRSVDPLHLLDFLRAHESTGVPLLLLHCYPFERQAGYLAQAFETVHIDVGLAINHLGSRSRSLIERSLELAPFGKVLYSSDAFGPAELHYLGARQWRAGMGAVLARNVTDGEWSERDATRVATMIGRDNARRVYRLA